MKKAFLKKIVYLVIVLVAAYFVYACFFKNEDNTVDFKISEVVRQDIIFYIDATGTVEPEDLVDVGARVSGEIIAFGKDKDGKEIDYGSTVAEGDILALIDNEIPQSNLLLAKAKLEQAFASEKEAKANIILSDAKLAQTERDFDRAKRLGVSEALSQSTFDAYLSAWEQAKANVDVAHSRIPQTVAQIAQAQATLKEAERNLQYCVIRAPVDGVIIDRKVNVGQTVVSSMSASSLFLIAKDLKKMEVWASVNEADIGNIQAGQEVVFTVDAFPEEIFHGKVAKIRLNASMTQNVVTYVVEVITDNSNLRLLPYLTANLKFEISKELNALTVPNSALRWNPDGFVDENDSDAPRVWILRDGEPKKFEVNTGITDGAYTTIKCNSINEGDLVITGINTQSTVANANTNPFAPKLPQRGRQPARR